DDPDQWRRPERAAELQDPRSKIDHSEGACRGAKCRFQDIRIWQVSLRPGFAIRRADAEAPAVSSRRVEYTGSESNRGRRHHTISPRLWISGENLQFPMTPRSSSRIIRTLVA